MVTGIGDCERPVHLRRNLDPVRLPIVPWRRARAGRPSHRGRWHARGRLVGEVRNQHPRHGVFLTAERREVHLPEVFEPGDE